MARFKYEPIPGNPEGATRITQVLNDRDQVALQFHYDSAGRLIAIADAVTDPQLTAARRVQYHYDARGRLQSSTDVAGYRTEYTYDDPSRLTQAWCQISTQKHGVRSRHNGFARTASK